MMEDLIELVAASFVRYGIECPAVDSSPVGLSPSLVQAMLVQAKSQLDLGPLGPAVIPQHGYRKKPEAGLAT